MISPAFFTDPDVGELSPLAALFFIGLWTIADREGRLDGDIRRLKALVFPYRAVDTEALAVELHGKDMIRRYQDEHGRRFIWIRNFTKHQRPHPKEPASVIPKCPDTAARKRGEPCNATAEPSESCIRNLDSGSLEVGLPSVVQPAALESALSEKPQQVAVDGFSAFWEAYPNKKGKDAARKAWAKRRPSIQMTALILAAIERQRAWPEWTKDRGEFIPHPATWLNRGSWDDEPRRAGQTQVGYEWDCPHQPKCGGRWACHSRQAIEAEKAKAS